MDDDGPRRGTLQAVAPTTGRLVAFNVAAGSAALRTSLAISVMGLLMVAQLTLTLVLFRQLGIMIMGTTRGLDDSGIRVGRLLPDLALTTVDGSDWSPRGGGSPSLVFFGAPHCVECKNITPLLSELDRSYGIRVVSLIFGDRDAASNYAAAEGLPSPVVSIGDAEGRAFDVEATPFAYAVDSDGIVVSKGLANSPDRIRQFAEACGARPPAPAGLTVIPATKAAR